MEEPAMMAAFTILSRSSVDNEDGPSRTLIIALSTTIPVVVVIILLAVVIFHYRRRNFRFLKRGITPIDDEEIESWRTEKFEEKLAMPTKADSVRRHQPSMSTSSIQKPASIIVYGRDTQYPARPSIDRSPVLGRLSLDVPAPVLAVAPNARLGLTDDMVQGDDAFIPRMKRQPSRLAKVQPPSPSKHQHNRSTNSHSSMHEAWYGYQLQDVAPHTSMPLRHSSERRPQTPPPQRGHYRLYSSSSIPPCPSHDEEFFGGGLSPRPLLHKMDIGRAIG